MAGDDRILEPDQYDPERRRVPDVFSYRLGQVEEKARRSEVELIKLERLVNEFIAAMPSKFVMRDEFKVLTEQLAHIETHMATANAATAIREHNASERQTVRLQWPAWILGGLLFLATVASLFIHHP